MHTRVLLVILWLATLTACNMWKEPKKGWAGATGGEQFERLWWQDLQTRRFDELAKRIAATFVGVTPDATLDRDGLMQHFRQLEITAYTLGEFVTQPNGPDLTVSYRAAVKGKLGDRVFEQRLRYLGVWQETRDGWVRTALSVTPEPGQ